MPGSSLSGSLFSAIATSTPLVGSCAAPAGNVTRYAVLVEDEAVVALDECEYLFLSEIGELDHNGLRLVVIEGRRPGETGRSSSEAP